MKLFFSSGFATAFLFISSLGFAQNQINLDLNHSFNDQAFVYGQTYTSSQGKSLEFSRVRYYLSSLEIVHDGGQLTVLDEVYVLAHANISSYDLGSYNIDVVEKLRFDVGVDYDANHGNSNAFLPSHPLGPQAPLMDWGWPSGYFFFDLNGAIDDNEDGEPNSNFEFRGFGDDLLTAVELNFNSGANSGQIDLSVQVFLDRWIGLLDLDVIGINHGNTQAHNAYMQNTTSNNVFVTGIAASASSLQTPSYIHVDYSMSYAPVLSYKLADKQTYSISVYDMSGRVVYQDKNLNHEGNYFILKELNSGTYIAKFDGLTNSQSKRFVVTK